jgi:hypothetical protein
MTPEATARKAVPSNSQVVVHAPIGVEAYPSRVVVANFDEDDKLDLAVANGNPDDVAVLFNAGSLEFTPPVS